MYWGYLKGGGEGRRFQLRVNDDVEDIACPFLYP